MFAQIPFIAVFLATFVTVLGADWVIRRLVR
jgi:hypothetical protein